MLPRLERIQWTVTIFVGCSMRPLPSTHSLNCNYLYGVFYEASGLPLSIPHRLLWSLLIFSSVNLKRHTLCCNCAISEHVNTTQSVLFRSVFFNYAESKVFHFVVFKLTLYSLSLRRFTSLFSNYDEECHWIIWT